MQQHRNNQKRIYCDDAVYFVTLYIKNRLPLFKEPILCDLFVEELRLCKQMRGFQLYAWVICYEHVHILFKPSNKYSYSDVMHYLKRHSSRGINIAMGYKPAPTHIFRGQSPESAGYTSAPGSQSPESADSYPRFLELEQVSKFRFKIKYLNKNPFPKFNWQKSFHDHIIRNDKDFAYHWEYIKRNPAKHKLPDGWPYVFTNPKYENLNDYIY